MVKILILKDPSTIRALNWVNRAGVPFKPVQGGWTKELDDAARMLCLKLQSSRDHLPNQQVFPNHDPNIQPQTRLEHKVLGTSERIPYVQLLHVDHEGVPGRQQVEGRWMEEPVTHYPPSNLLWFQDQTFWIVDQQEFINQELGLRLLPGRIRQCQLPYLYPQMLWYDTGRLFPVDPLVVVKAPRVIEYPLDRRPLKRACKRSRDFNYFSDGESESEDGGASKRQRRSEDPDSEEEWSPRPGTSGESRKRSRDGDDGDNIHTKRQRPL